MNKCICKLDYPGPGSYQTFLSGETYEYDNIWNETLQEFWYSVKNDIDRFELFSNIDYKDYFISLKELRKQKLNKIKNLREYE